MTDGAEGVFHRADGGVVRAAAWHRSLIESASPAAATLVAGQAGAGRDELALALAASFAGLHEDGDSGAPTAKGELPRSAAAILSAIKKSSGKEWYANKTADILIVAPDGDSLPVDAARRVIEFAALEPVARPRRVAVLLRAEAMTAAAANALLKTLEEPSPKKALILSARAASLLPPTIVSRCRMVSAAPPDESQAAEWLSSLPEAPSAEALAYCGGLPLLAADADMTKATEAIGFFATGKNLDMHAAARAFANFDGWLDCLQKWTADGCRAAFGLPPRYFPGSEQQCAALRASPRTWLDVHAMLQQKRRLQAHPLASDVFIKDILHDYRLFFNH